MDNDLGRLVDRREARRPHSGHSDGTRLCYPYAAGGTDKDDDDDDYVAEALTDVPAAEPPVASPAQIQSLFRSQHQCRLRRRARQLQLELLNRVVAR